MNPILYTIFLLILLTSTIITFSSHHWLLAWIGLELNTLAMIPLISKPHHPRATEAAVKYFIIQTLASTIVLLSGTITAWQTGQWMIPQLTTTTLFTIALAMKLGLAPVHLWYPEVLQGTTLTTVLIISTWQKFAPLALLYMTLSHLSPNLLLFLGLISVTVGGWAGLGHTQLRKIMAYSSIGHMGWLMAALALNPALATLTIIIYVIMTAATLITLINTTAKTLSDIGAIWPQAPTQALLLMLSLLSLGGLPPLTGFIPKWFILENLTLNHLTALATPLALMSLPALYFYVRLTYFTTLTTPPTTQTLTFLYRLKQTPTLTPALTTILATTTLPLAHTIYSALT
uniref:NADH-ubiquinone oxidoreductase chain 2 n=1 Tax=Pristurus celerrimus TaxID=706252 RepID=D3XB23_9SAUR|nr:NADH dehydrogenase subunit 2 [Pristurus celerrimus]